MKRLDENRAQSTAECLAVRSDITTIRSDITTVKANMVTVKALDDKLVAMKTVITDEIMNKVPTKMEHDELAAEVKGVSELMQSIPESTKNTLRDERGWKRSSR